MCPAAVRRVLGRCGAAPAGSTRASNPTRECGAVGASQLWYARSRSASARKSERSVPRASRLALARTGGSGTGTQGTSRALARRGLRSPSLRFVQAPLPAILLLSHSPGSTGRFRPRSSSPLRCSRHVGYTISALRSDCATLLQATHSDSDQPEADQRRQAGACPSRVGSQWPAHTPAARVGSHPGQARLRLNRIEQGRLWVDETGQSTPRRDPAGRWRHTGRHASAGSALSS